MNVSFNSFLISYKGCDNYLLNKISNFCLSPLVTAFGRTIKLYPIPYDSTQLEFPESKTHHLAIRLLSALTAVIFFPMTLMGILIRKCSDSPFHQMDIANEKRFLAQLNSKLVEKAESLTSNILFDFIKENPSRPIDEIIQTNLISVLDDLLILATCLHDLIRLEDPNLDYYVKIYHDKVFQLKPIIEKSIEQAQAKTCLLFPEDNSRFKKKVHEQLELLKKSLRLILFHRNKFEREIKQDLEEYHTFIRENYYKLFIGRHFVFNNLHKKKEISAFKITPQKIFGSLNKSELDALYVEMQTIFDQHLESLFSIEWFHKTNSSTLINIVQSKGKLKSIYQLNKENQLIFHYKKDEEFSDLSLTISFVARSYLDLMIPQLQEADKDLLICQNPKRVIKNDYFKLFSNLTEELSNSNNLSDFYQKNFSLYGLWEKRRQLKILRMLNAPLFEEVLLPKIKAFNQCLEKSKQKLNKETIDCRKQFEDLHAVIKSMINLENDSYDENDRLFLYEEDYPIVFGMTHPHNANSLERHEASGPLEWGKEIKFLFMPLEKARQKDNYLQLKKFQNVEKVEVYSLNLLRVLPHLQRFINHKKKPKDFDKRLI